VGGRKGDLAGQTLQVQDTLEVIADLRAADRVVQELADRVQPSVDLLGVEERAEQAVSEEAPAHGRHGEVDHVQERVVDLLVPEVFDQLEVSDRGRVEDAGIAGRKEGQAVDQGQRVLPNPFQVEEQPAGGRDSPGFPFKAEAGQGRNLEMLEKGMPGLGEIEGPGLDGAFDDGLEVAVFKIRDDGFLGPFREDDLLGRSLGQLVDQAFGPGGRPFQDAHLPRGDVDQGQAPSFRIDEQTGDEDVFLGCFRIDLDRGPGRQDLDDFALDDTLGQPRILDLLADRDLIAAAEELGRVLGDGVVGHAAHRDFLAGGQGDFEDPRADGRVLVEHLVEIPQAEEQESVRMGRLDPEILLHHRSRRVVGEQAGLVHFERIIA